MANFVYKARDAQGGLARGVIDAEDETKAALAVEKLGLSPVSISLNAGFNPRNLPQLRLKKVTHQELLIFTRQLSALISTGAPLITSLENVSDQTANLRFKQIIKDIISSLESGISFSKS